MGKVADVRACPGDNLTIGLDQRVGVARERRNLDWEAAIKPLGGARTDSRKTRRNALERCKPETDLKGRDQEEHNTYNRKGSPQRAVEATRLVVDLNGVAGNHHQESSFVTAAQRPL